MSRPPVSRPGRPSPSPPSIAGHVSFSPACPPASAPAHNAGSPIIADGRFRHNPTLDGIRAVAILAVVAFHFGIPGARSGFYGVDVFFVLSGFLITSILVAERERTGGIDFRKFYLRRALRLFPALYAVFAVCFVWSYCIADSELGRATRRGIVVAAFYASNWWRAFGGAPLGNLEITWSLAIEEQFYILWPILAVLVLRYVKSRRLAAAGAIGLALGVCGLRIALYRAGVAPERLTMGLDTRADGLLIGSALALFLSSDCPFLARTWAPSAMRLAGIVGAAITFGSVVLVHKDAPYAIVVGYTVVSLGVALVVLSLMTHPAPLLARLFAWRPVVYIGRISYGIYLWHWVVLTMFGSADLFEVRGAKGYAIRLACVGAGIASAAVSFRVVEEPFLRLKSRFGKV